MQLLVCMYIYVPRFPYVQYNSVYAFLFLSQSKGVKGLSVLALHKPFDICRGVVIDSLHCVYLGVTLKMLKLWFDKETRTETFSIRTKVGWNFYGLV